MAIESCEVDTCAIACFRALSFSMRANPEKYDLVVSLSRTGGLHWCTLATARAKAASALLGRGIEPCPLGPLARAEHSVADETIRFALPREVRETSPVSALPDEVSANRAQGMV